MESTQVVIVGAGPSGLVLGLALAKQNIHSVILEKTTSITEDPRGVFLAGDANRILYHMGIGPQFPRIGHVVHDAQFHRSSFANEPFFKVPFNRNALCQEVPDAVLQSQPKLGEIVIVSTGRPLSTNPTTEQALRDRLLYVSQYVELREGCEVVGRQERDDCIVVEYRDCTGKLKNIKGEWLVAADGKRGVVRKQFLEPTAGIVQETGTYQYDGVWIVCNLKLTVPTPESHPDFPLWDFGLTTEQVYDLYWPVGWHFLSPPGAPTACGRFGPHSDRYWRHEIEVESDEQTVDPQRTILNSISSMITRDRDGAGRQFPKPVMYPKDCIAVHRCGPVRFVQKKVNKWFHHRTILIGDAAHVFPPFGGQGIACGIRDAHSLSWRLALTLRRNIPIESAHGALHLWSQERSRGVEDSVATTMSSGSLCRGVETWREYAMRRIITNLSVLPPFRDALQLRQIAADKGGNCSPDKGFHLYWLNGGFKVAQVNVKSATSLARKLSDQLYHNGAAAMTLLVIGRHSKGAEDSVQGVLHRVGLHPSILSTNSIRYLDLNMEPEDSEKANQMNDSATATVEDPEYLKIFTPTTSQDRHNFLSRLGRSTAYAIVRPDFYVFAVASTVHELETIL